jgi:lipoprotein-anchoring transpeptidase ErfK/SrfK
MKARQLLLLTGSLSFFLLSLSATPTSCVLPAPSSVLVPTKTSSKNNREQEPGRVNPSILEKASNEPVSLQISLSKQRVYLLVGGKVAIDSPISSGKKRGWTPQGEFVILEKDPDHQSSLYGDFVDERGKIIRSGISKKLNEPPSGTHYCGASMKFFMRLTPEGVGMHAGFLPGYPASHGCIRLPKEMAQLIYSNVALHTPVSIMD